MLMKKAGFVLFFALFSLGPAWSKVGLDLDNGTAEADSKSAKPTGFILHKEKYHEKLTPVVDKSVFSVVEMGSCEVKSEERTNTLATSSEARKNRIWIELDYRLCQKVDYYQAKDVSYFGMIHRKGIFDKDDYRKTRYVSQEADEGERKVFRVGSVDFKTLKDIEIEKNKIYEQMNSGKADVGSKVTLAALERDEDILKNVLEQTLSKCEAYKESVLKNENRSNENFCEE